MFLCQQTFFRRRGCILTQLPFQHTAVDFWRLVIGNDVNIVVSLGAESDVNIELCICYDTLLHIFLFVCYDILLHFPFGLFVLLFCFCFSLSGWFVFALIVVVLCWVCLSGLHIYMVFADRHLESFFRFTSMVLD